MIVNYDIPKINQALQDFRNATGIHMALLKDDFSIVGDHSFWEKKRYCKAIQTVEAGKKACHCSDAELFHKSRESKKAEIHICHAGLIDVSVPILYNDVIIGYIVFGQMKTSTDFSDLKEYIAELGLDEEKMKKYYSAISLFNVDKIQSISNLAEMLVKHILLENMLKPNFDESIQKAINYISENLDKNLTIQSIAKNTNSSKSALYRRFHSCLGCTISQYITRQRVEKSVELLTNSDLSIEEVALQVGFSNGSYFCKMFKKEKGLTPFNFRKLKNKSR